MGKLFYFIIHQCNIRRIHGDIASHAAHGDAHICLFQRRRVVDAVSDHTHSLIFLLIRLYLLQLILRKTVGMYLLDLKLSGNGPGRIFMIPRQKHRLHILLFQTPDHVRALFPQRIGKSHVTGQGAVHRQINQRASLLLILLCFLFHLIRDTDLMLLHHPVISSQDPFPLRQTGYPPARNHPKLLTVLRVFPGFLFITAHHRFPQRMLGQMLRRRAEAVQLFLRVPGICASHRGHLGHPVGQRSRFVKGNL